MRLDGHEQSSNVEDRRGQRAPAMLAGGGGLLLVVMMIVMNLMGVDQDKQRVAIGVAKAIQQKSQIPLPLKPVLASMMKVASSYRRFCEARKTSGQTSSSSMWKEAAILHRS